MSTNKLQELQKKWDKKLKDSGFEDIEDKNGNLKVWTSVIRKIVNPALHDSRQQYWATKREYYRLAGFFLYEHKFKNNTEKFIWEKHSNGMSLRELSKVLALKEIHFKKDKLNKIINDLKQLMLEKYKVSHDSE